MCTVQCISHHDVLQVKFLRPHHLFMKTSSASNLFLIRALLAKLSVPSHIMYYYCTYLYWHPIMNSFPASVGVCRWMDFIGQRKNLSLWSLMATMTNTRDAFCQDWSLQYLPPRKEPLPMTKRPWGWWRIKRRRGAGASIAGAAAQNGLRLEAAQNEIEGYVESCPW